MPEVPPARQGSRHITNTRIRKSVLSSGKASEVKAEIVKIRAQDVLATVAPHLVSVSERRPAPTPPQVGM